MFSIWETKIPKRVENMLKFTVLFNGSSVWGTRMFHTEIGETNIVLCQAFHTGPDSEHITDHLAEC